MKASILSVLLISLFISNIQSQTSREPGAHLPKPTPAGVGKIDTRIDNMGYWKRMADSGYVEVAPMDNVPQSHFTGSRIEGRGVMSANSGDVSLHNFSTTQSENSIFVKPTSNTTLLNSNNSTLNPNVGLYGANYFTSSDGGQTWGGEVYGPTGASNSGDPTTAIDLSGRYFVGYITDDGGQGVAYSTDAGISWNAVVVSAIGSSSVLDKNHMWVDNKSTSPYNGYLYVAWTDFGGTNDSEIEIKRSINNGVSWTSEQVISTAIAAGSHNQGVNIQTGPGGQVYVCWAVYDTWPSDETVIGFNKSTNGGASFGTASRIISNIRGIRTTETSKNMRVNSFPSMAVDISGGSYDGNIYIVWANIGVPGVNTGSDIDIYMIKSTNQGTSWSAPVRVNQDPTGQGNQHFFPWITCDPVTGYLAVVYYDDRNVLPSQCETWVSVSFDAGTTWEDIKVSDVAFTPAPIPGMAGGYMGDYLAISSRGGQVYPVWTDNRTGSAMSYISPFEMNLMPEADFTANDQTPCFGDTVLFEDLSWRNPTSWLWTITPTTFTYVGGTSQTSRHPKVVFNSPGDYTVKLRVTNTHGADSMTVAGFISMNFANADFAADKTSTVINTPITFSDASTCNVLSWNYNFGAGAIPPTASTQGPHSVQYSTTGDKTVSLTVNGDATTTKTNYIHIVPTTYNMTNGEVYTCSGTFYDSQGASNYQNDEDYLFTFYPQTPGNAIRATFSAFNIEGSDGCVWDYLAIYNGTSISDPVIGLYCDTTSPGTITASNPSGALTFQFHSDFVGTASGWQAAISCVAITPAYCTASAGCDEHISNVTIGGINNSSACTAGGYANYTGISTIIQKGMSYALTVTNGTPYPGDECFGWIDWNQDKDFYDVGEAFKLQGGPTSFTSQIIPPEDAVYGSIRMRLRLYYNGSTPTAYPCGSATYGEVEDYTLFLGQPGLWVGGASGQQTNWNTPANWHNNAVPTSTTDVLIPGGLTYYPVLATSGSCRNLEIRDGATVTVNAGGNLTVNNDLMAGQGTGGTLIVNGGTCTVHGDALQRSGSGIQVKNGGTLTQD